MCVCRCDGSVVASDRMSSDKSAEIGECERVRRKNTGITYTFILMSCSCDHVTCRETGYSCM